MAFKDLKRSYRKEGHRLFSRVCGDRTRGNGFKLKEGRGVRYTENIFYSEGGEAQEQAAQRYG